MSNFNESKSMSNIVIDESLKRRIFSKYREAIENGNATTGESPATDKTTFIHVAPPTQKKGFTTQGKIIVGLVSITLLIADKIEELMETNETLLKELENLQSQCQFQIETLIHRWNYFIFIFVEVLKIAPTMFL